MPSGTTANRASSSDPRLNPAHRAGLPRAVPSSTRSRRPT
ncbi:hypothetical protein RISW2_13025 [Roseivivax isoporae LMG 25204]|uniref:Uncharacterized protein n=1 Tax=Roseivivax isoporae LMG 25204 TaxID=1449351 RepID=X7FEU5_9RHOB|nr:hypothetical protein RISW2_13025 [Roseivivax isoporae LMG 25204]